MINTTCFLSVIFALEKKKKQELPQVGKCGYKIKEESWLHLLDEFLYPFPTQTREIFLTILCLRTESC